jgi:hypothetical protein
MLPICHVIYARLRAAEHLVDEIRDSLSSEIASQHFI